MLITDVRPSDQSSPAPATDPQVASLRQRAASLREQAEHLFPLLATTYRRRASELELEAFLLDLSASAA